jgi:hypothetical protein
MNRKKRQQKRRTRDKAQAKKKLRRQPKPKRHSQSAIPSLSRSPFIGIPPSGAPEAPKGFRPVTMTQAMMEFAEPVMEFVETGTVSEPNAALQISLQIWNYTLPNILPQMETSRAKIVAQIRKTLKMDRQEAETFFNLMVERKAYLLPEEIQPEGPTMTMFIRKEIEYLVTKFDASQLTLSETPIPPDPDDQNMLNDLRQMDAYIAEDTDYDEWEDHFFVMQEACCERFSHWLTAKGVADDCAEDFPFCVQTYLNFIYQYDAGKLRNVSFSALYEFFMDFLLRKVMAKPSDYVQYPFALKLFYGFLAEKGYLDNPGPVHALFDKIEPDFVALVKDRF